MTSISWGSAALPLAAIGLSCSALLLIPDAASMAEAVMLMQASAGGGWYAVLALPHLGDRWTDGGGEEEADKGVLRKIGKCASAKSAINIDTSADCRWEDDTAWGYTLLISPVDEQQRLAHQPALSIRSSRMVSFTPAKCTQPVLGKTGLQQLIVYLAKLNHLVGCFS